MTLHFRPLLHALELSGTVVTFDALHTVKEHLSWLVKIKKTHYIAALKTNQPTAHQDFNPALGKGAHRPHRLDHRARAP